MPSLKKVIGRLERSIPKDAKHMTLDGRQAYTKFRCVECENMFYVGEAFLQSKSRRKHANDIRPFCVPCYNVTNGKRGRSKEHKSTASLDKFFELDIL